MKDKYPKAAQALREMRAIGAFDHIPDPFAAMNADFARQPIPEEPTGLRKVAWCNVWNRAAAFHSDVGSRVHLTESAGVEGKTLCGRAFPADKGHPAAGWCCKRCLNIAQKRGYSQAFTSALDWVPSREYDG